MKNTGCAVHPSFLNLEAARPAHHQRTSGMNAMRTSNAYEKSDAQWRGFRKSFCNFSKENREALPRAVEDPKKLEFAIADVNERGFWTIYH